MENSVQPPPEPLARPASRAEGVRALAAARGVPLAAILTTCGVVVAIYLAGKLAYQMRNVLMMIAPTVR